MSQYEFSTEIIGLPSQGKCYPETNPLSIKVLKKRKTELSCALISEKESNEKEEYKT